MADTVGFKSSWSATCATSATRWSDAEIACAVRFCVERPFGAKSATRWPDMANVVAKLLPNDAPDEPAWKSPREQNDKKVAHGAVAYKTVNLTYTVADTKSGAEFLAFLVVLVARCVGRKILLATRSTSGPVR
jgi:hypothetical protein